MTKMDNEVDKKTLKSYDETPYPSAPIPETHPNRLSAVAMIYGMTPTPVTSCRVLELGCGSGTNLISMASGLPGSQFVGIDLSRHEVELANQFIQALGLKNIDIRHGDVMAITKELGQFDYIIAHGLYSWVPPEVREKILSVIQELLAGNGIAFVSYNTYPGWSAYSTVREMMRYHVRDIKDPHEAVRSARKFISELPGLISPGVNAYYGLMLQHVAEISKPWSDSYFYHDALAEINQPQYFYQFANAAAEHKLVYVAEADFHSSVARNLSEQSIALLQKMGENLIDKEQHMDFMFNRMFRMTLLCHDKALKTREIDIQVIRQFYLAAPLMPVPEDLDLHAEGKIDFMTFQGVSVSTKDLVAKALWSYMSSQWPRPVNFNKIAKSVQLTLEAGNSEAKKLAASDSLSNLIAQHLWDGFSVGLLRLFVHPQPVALQISERPVATALARYQADHPFFDPSRPNAQPVIVLTNQLHDAVLIDNFQHHILPMLDGHHDREAITAKLKELVQSGKIKLQRGGVPVTSSEEVDRVLAERLDDALHHFVRLALLTA